MAAVRTRPGSVADLLDDTIRNRYMVAYWSGLDDLLVHEHVANTSPGNVTWLPVTAVEDRGVAVRFTAGGHTFQDIKSWPIVLGEVTP